MLASRDVDGRSTHLWDRYTRHRDPEARTRLILRYSPLVGRICRKMSSRIGTSVERGELVSCGMLGLIDAIERYRADRNIKFETYATLRIQGAMLDHLRSLDWLPRALREKKRKLDEAFGTLENQLGRTPTEAEVAAQLGMQVSRLQKLLVDLHCAVPVSLEASHERDATSVNPVFEALADKGVGPEQRLIDAEAREQLVRAVSRLPERERIVVSLYYFEAFTLRQIGRVIHLSEAAVSMVHRASLARLRALFRVEEAV